MVVCVCVMRVRQFILFSQHESNFLLYIICDLIELILCYIMSIAVTGRQRQRDKRGAREMDEEGDLILNVGEGE